VRDGPARDSRADQGLEAWAGVVPMRMAAGTPVAAEYVDEGAPLSASVRTYVEREQDLQN